MDTARDASTAERTIVLALKGVYLPRKLIPMDATVEIVLEDPMDSTTILSRLGRDSVVNMQPTASVKPDPTDA